MSSRPFHGVAYKLLRECAKVTLSNEPQLTLHVLFYAASEDVDIAFEGSLNGDVILDEFPDRQRVERSLLRKLDLRMSILVLIWTLNFVSQVATQ